MSQMHRTGGVAPTIRGGLRFVIGAALALCFASPACAESCGIASLSDLCQLVGDDLAESQRQALVSGYPAKELSMLDIRRAAEMTGLALVGVAAPFDRLADGLPGPKIIHLSDPDHFSVMTRASAEWVQVLDHGEVTALPRQALEKRYSGHALILDQGEFPRGGPRLEAPEFHHTLGIAGVGQQVEHAFTVRNVGGQELIVHPQEKGCRGAPKVTIGQEALAPGANTQVTVSFTIGHSGSVMKSAELLTTDPTQPVVYLTVHGTVPHDLRTYPDRVYLGGEKDAIPARTVTISGPAEMDVTEVGTERGLFDLTLSEPQVFEDEKKTWTLELAFKPESFVGGIEDQLSIKTTHPERPLVTIPINGGVRGDLRVIPPSVFFGFVNPCVEAQQTIAIESRSFAPFAVKSVTSDSPKITAGTPENNDGVWSIPVSVDTTAEGVVEGSLTVTTDVPGEETLRIPVYAHIIEQQ